MKNHNVQMKSVIQFCGFMAIGLLSFLGTSYASAQIKLEQEVKITDSVMFFDGVSVPLNTTTNSTTGYDYVYGNALTPHGDCIKTYKNFVFLTWYRGGKLDRHVMLSRYNTETKVLKTIEFPHQHTGYDGKWWIGETHNTISVGICPKDSTIHMLYDMHRNGNVPAFANDYLRYSYTVDGGATVADDDFTIDQFVNSPAGNYKHLSFNGIDDVTVTKLLTYPDFFTNDEGDLFMKNRFGYAENGRFLFAKYDGIKWKGYTDFNRSNASNYGSQFNWGLYGEIKYLNGKIRIGFQRRSNNGNDKFLYQNGIYYAYSDDPSGLTQWKDFKGQEFTRPLADADKIKIAEPGDWVQTTQKDKVYIVGGFDFTVTAAGDEHFVSTVKDNQYNVTKKLHTYRKAGDADFTTVEYNAGSELYAAGNDVFVIGLKNGRVNIVKTEGGTSNFRQVYQNTTGPTFDKGVANIYDGKLYYYLKKAGGTGDKRTTYLQIFDLDVNLTPVDTSRYLNFKNLLDGQEIESGSSLTIEANAGSAFNEVSLWLGDTNLGTLTSRPYVWSSLPILTNMTEASYNFKLVAKDIDGVSVEKSATVYTPVVEELSDKKSLIISFEDGAVANWQTDGVDYGVVPTVADGVNVRTGSKVMTLDYSTATSGHHIQNTVDKIVVPDQFYFHAIFYCATSDNAYGKTAPTAKIGDWIPTPSFLSFNASNTFERFTTDRQNTTGDSLNCYPRLRSRAQGGACTIYYDDLVLYADTNSVTDLVGPSSAQNFTFGNITPSSIAFSWAEGIDELSGVSSTLILRTSNLNAPDPEMFPQVGYAVTEGNSGIHKVGDWNVIAIFGNGKTSYTDNSITSGEDYKYAVVHKDLAYNYSMPLVESTVPNAIDNNEIVPYSCYGVVGGIELNTLPYGEDVSIYNIKGEKVFHQRSQSSVLSVSMAQGIYIVNVSGKRTKVVVK